MKQARLSPLVSPPKLGGYDVENVQRYVEVMGSGDACAALWKAARAGEEDLVRGILAETSDAAEALRWANSAYHDYTALHIASQKGHFSVVSLLLDMGADIHAQAHGGTTALHEAAYEKHELLSLYLIQRGASLYTQTSQGATPYDFAQKKHFAETLQSLYEQHLRSEAEKQELRQALAKSIFDTNITGVDLVRCQKLVESDEERRGELHERISKLETKLLERNSEVEYLHTALRLEQERVADLETLVQEANARRRRAEHDLGDATFEMQGLRDQVNQAERSLREITSENAHMDKLIQTSVQAVRKKQNLALNKRTSTPRALRLRTLEARVKAAEEEAYQAHCDKKKAEQQVFNRDLAYKRIEATLHKNIPLIIRLTAEKLANQWCNAGVRRVQRAQLYKELQNL